MMLSENKFNMLLQRVVFDHEILTHRVVARSFKVDTTTAKKILAEFVQRSDGRAHATYILTGFIKNGAPGASGQSMHSFGSAPSGLLTSSNESGVNGAGNGDVAMSGGNEDEGIPSSSAPQAGPSSQAYVTELKTQEERPIDQVECIMLVPQEELQEKAALFSTILSQDVYSAEPTRLPDLVLLTDANAPVLKDKDLAAVGPDVLGTIKHYRPSVKKSGQSSKSSTAASTSNSALDKSKEKAKAKDSTKDAPEKSKPDLKRKASNTELDPAKSKSASSSKATSPAATSKDKGKDKAAPQKTSGPSLNDLFKSDTGSKKSSSSDTKKLSKQPSKEAAADDDFDDMLADDDDMMAEIDALETKKTGLSENASKAASSQSGKGDTASAGKKEKVTLQSGGRRRKTRKVKKQIQEVNAKGYKVTKEVETEEEYTASDSDDDGPVVASTSAASKAAKESKDKEKEKSKPKEKPAEKAKLEKKPSFTKNASSSTSSQAKSKAGNGGQTSLAGFFGKPKPKK